MSTLKDIAGHIDSRYGAGAVKVWYMKPEFFRDGIMGHEWLEEQGKVPSLATLEATHVLVGTLDIDNVEEAWQMMQGEFWSPQGEANSFIRGLGLRHTSMSVGDVVQKDNTLFLVDGIGFKKV